MRTPAVEFDTLRRPRALLGVSVRAAANAVRGAVWARVALLTAEFSFEGFQYVTGIHNNGHDDIVRKVGLLFASSKE